MEKPIVDSAEQNAFDLTEFNLKRYMVLDSINFAFRYVDSSYQHRTNEVNRHNADVKAGLIEAPLRTDAPVYPSADEQLDIALKYFNFFNKYSNIKE